MSAAGTELKTIAPPEFAGSADEGICYTYEINLKNGLFAADELVFLQLEDDEYYFKISSASDMADGLPNTARGKTAECDTVVATVAGSAENRASDDEARAERSLDAACDKMPKRQMKRRVKRRARQRVKRQTRQQVER